MGRKKKVERGGAKSFCQGYTQRKGILRRKAMALNYIVCLQHCFSLYGPVPVYPSCSCCSQPQCHCESQVNCRSLYLLCGSHTSNITILMYGDVTFTGGYIHIHIRLGYFKTNTGEMVRMESFAQDHLRCRDLEIISMSQVLLCGTIPSPVLPHLCHCSTLEVGQLGSVCTVCAAPLQKLSVLIFCHIPGAKRSSDGQKSI